MRCPDDGVAVLRLALDTSDPVQRLRIEGMFGAAHAVRKALQRDARDRARAYRAATHERARDPGAVRDRLGLTRTALAHRAYALAMHRADSVWSALERHLFKDARGKTFGVPKIRHWFDFRRLPGRARSHTKIRKWETFRLHGSLAGHRAAYSDDRHDFFQPRTLRPIESEAWWSYEALVVVFSGLATGTLALPVRLPSAPSNQPILDHYLSDPTRWHKIDLVRERDPGAPDGWRYEAHLMVLAGTAPDSTLNEPGIRQTTSDRIWMRINLPPESVRTTNLRDSS